jgi:hypothetical protein
MKIRPERAELFHARRTDLTKLNANAPSNSFTGSRVVALEQTTRQGDVNRCIIAGFLAKAPKYRARFSLRWYPTRQRQTDRERESDERILYFLLNERGLSTLFRRVHKIAKSDY